MSSAWKLTSTKKLLLVLKLVLIISVGGLVSETTTHFGDRVCVLAEGDTAEAIRLTALEEAFGDEFERSLDLIFIIDRSNSIGEIEFNETKHLISELISFLSERRYISLNNKSTRIAVVSFGIQATPEFDGISDEGNQIDACVFEERLNGMKLKNGATNQSRIPMALSRAENIFSSSRHDADRINAKQILWIFFDGAEGVPLFYKGRSSEDWAKDLRDRGVQIFGVGVGAWLKIDIERENRVSELATSNAHYACVETWMEILNKAPEPTQIRKCR